MRSQITLLNDDCMNVMKNMKDKEYYKAACDRLDRHKAQEQLF